MKFRLWKKRRKKLVLNGLNVLFFHETGTRTFFHKGFLTRFRLFVRDNLLRLASFFTDGFCENHPAQGVGVLWVTYQILQW